MRIIGIESIASRAIVRILDGIVCVVGHLNGRTATAKKHGATIFTAIVPVAATAAGSDLVLFAHVHAGTGKDNEHVPTPNHPEDASDWL